MYDYEKSCEAACLDNIGWRYTPHKRVNLQLSNKDKKKVEKDIYKMVFSHLGHFEWEVWTSRMVANAIQKANDMEKDEVEITPLFECDLLGWDGCGENTMEYVKTASCFEHQLKDRLFEVVSENANELQLKFKDI